VRVFVIDKSTTRRRFLEARRSQTKKDKSVRDQAMGTHLLRLLIDLEISEDIMAFRPLDSEADPFLGEVSPLHFFPRVLGEELECVSVKSSDHFEKSEFGVMEPRGEAVAPSSVRAVLIPGVAFDRRGTRLGFGKGFYDRFLSKISPSVPRIGVAYSFQVSSEELPRDEWDESVDWIVSDAFVLNVTKGSN
jgi:5-formyltetrahydrofolate cyclo-ligase